MGTDFSSSSPKSGGRGNRWEDDIRRGKEKAQSRGGKVPKSLLSTLGGDVHRR